MNPVCENLKSLYEKLFFTGDSSLEEQIGIEELGLGRKEAVEFFSTMAQHYFGFWPEKVEHFMAEAYSNYNMKPTRATEKIIKKTHNFMWRLAAPETPLISPEIFNELQDIYDRTFASDVSEEEELQLDKRRIDFEKNLPLEQLAFFHYVRICELGSKNNDSLPYQNYLADLEAKMAKKNPAALLVLESLCQEYLNGFRKQLKNSDR